MYPAIIEEYVAPATLAEALEALDRYKGDATVFAGGMSIMQAVKARLVEPRCVIDLGNLGELRGVTLGAEGVRIGPMTRYRDLAVEDKLNGAYQAINDAAATVADRQVRNRGTIGGSICWNYLAADLPPTVLTLDAAIELTSAGGKVRSVAAGNFFLGALETARAENELVTAIRLAPAPARAGSAYKKWATLVDGLPVIGVAVYVETDGGGVCTAARLGVGGILPVVKRATAAEGQLIGAKAGDTEALDAALATAADEIDPQGDRWAEAEYRKLLIRDLGRQVVATAFERAMGGPA